ncbi:GNAT family N-acetyltransferase [Lysobacter cavernae]|uniref:GNAT family N-acetyltransferase n=1 Tax=Lysobacter cavernae TaxID=1685901 RepID=A0ABV7RQ47_9GAMM
MAIDIRSADAADHAAILALNLESEQLLSPLSAARLARLDAQAAYHRVLCDDGAVVAFLLAFAQGADYDSPNYRWFAQRYERFLYIDRVVVAASHQGRRLGSRLYEDLFAFARGSGIATVTCEFYVVPLNEASRRFHAGFGFREVGTQWVAEGRKQVSLQTATA